MYGVTEWQPRSTGNITCLEQYVEYTANNRTHLQLVPYMYIYVFAWPSTGRGCGSLPLLALPPLSILVDSGGLFRLASHSIAGRAGSHSLYIKARVSRARAPVCVCVCRLSVIAFGRFRYCLFTTLGSLIFPDHSRFRYLSSLGY